MCDLRDIKMWLTGQYHPMIIQSDIKALKVQVIPRPIQKWLKQHIICKLKFNNEENFDKKCGVNDKMLLIANLFNLINAREVSGLNLRSICFFC